MSAHYHDVPSKSKMTNAQAIEYITRQLAIVGVHSVEVTIEGTKRGAEPKFVFRIWYKDPATLLQST